MAAAAVLTRTAEPALAAAALLLAVLLALDGSRSVRRARCCRVGAESEAHVRRALKSLARGGWHVRHSLDWPGHGDLDHVVRAPSGIGFVIETKTLRYTRTHGRRTADAARWLGRNRRRYPLGVRPVICVARGRRPHWHEDGVLVTGLDDLVSVLCREAQVALSDNGRADISQGGCASTRDRAEATPAWPVPGSRAAVRSHG